MTGVAEFASIPLAGLPLFVWLGALALLLLITTAAYGYGLMKGKIRGSIKTHMIIAGLTLAVALVHAGLAASLFL